MHFLQWRCGIRGIDCRYHRTFSQGELDRYPKKDVATYWQCEDYPKAWGHGMRDNPLPRRLNRTDPGPMRDRTLFRSATTIPRIPQSLQPVSKWAIMKCKNFLKVPIIMKLCFFLSMKIFCNANSELTLEVHCAAMAACYWFIHVFNSVACAVCMLTCTPTHLTRSEESSSIALYSLQWEWKVNYCMFSIQSNLCMHL